MADAHHFTWHGTGQSLLAAQLDAIAAARSSIEMEIFTFRHSVIGERFREALTAAARRGVRVRLITNSLFISDGPSKIIRITMQNWMDYMLAHYPNRFEVRFVTYAGKHMTHFKGAAFGCQRRLLGQRGRRSQLHGFDFRRRERRRL